MLAPPSNFGRARDFASGTNPPDFVGPFLKISAGVFVEEIWFPLGIPLGARTRACCYARLRV